VKLPVGDLDRAAQILRQTTEHGMQNGAPLIGQAHRGGMLRLAFLSAVVSLVVSFAAAAAPIPLYNIYRADDGFTNFGISMAIVTYSVGTMAGLLVLGRLSNHLGRRLAAIASLGLLLLGCLLLLSVHNIGSLLAGRVLMGVGTGVASSTLSSYIVDAAPARPEWLASVASSQGPMLGLTVGAIASGALVQFGLWPRELIYLVASASYQCLQCSSPSARKLQLRGRPLGDHCYPGSAYRLGSGICSLSRLRCSRPPGRPEPSTKPSYLRSSKINSTPVARSSSD
jgi:Major Facilitator Superfamily